MKSEADLRTPSTLSRFEPASLFKHPTLNINTENAKFLPPRSKKDFITSL